MIDKAAILNVISNVIYGRSFCRKVRTFAVLPHFGVLIQFSSTLVAPLQICTNIKVVERILSR